VTDKNETSQTFTKEERAAMKERAKELKKSASDAENLKDQLAKIAEMADDDRAIAERLHEAIMVNVPELTPKLWYGMPGYALDGKIVCFFQDANKFKSRYATFGFNDSANLDDGDMWPTSFALTAITPAIEEKIVALVKKAAS
jgi:uncharacterized protein YdhG (YjbR/CyaY superfamily)